MRDKWPDGLEIWGVTRTEGRKVWVGLAITGLEDPSLALSVESERIIRQNGRDVLVDPTITPDRFGWEEDDLTISGLDEEDDR